MRKYQECKTNPASAQNYSAKPEEKEKLTVHLVAGSIAGFTTAFCGHPLDTIKVRMQVLNGRFWSCCKTMIKQEGFISLFKGVQSPLVSAPFSTAISFGSYELSKKILHIKKSEKMTFWKGMAAGGCAGFLYAGFSTPMELLKCRSQMAGAGQKAKSAGPFAIAMDIVRRQGIKGLYRGYWITCLRDIPGGAVQFGAYEVFKNLFSKDTVDPKTTHFFAGGLAKFTTWFVCHPQDLIKTKLQCKTGYQGISECSKEIWQKYGSSGFWRGSLPSIVRTFLSGALTFAVYEEAKKTLSQI